MYTTLHCNDPSARYRSQFATGLSLLPVSVYKDPIVTITIVNDSKENETKKFGVGKPVVIWY